jgi:hypothetical protein
VTCSYCAWCLFDDHVPNVELPPPLPNESHQCHWTISYDTSDVPHRQRSSGSTLRGTVWCAPALSRPVLEGICAMQHQRSMRAAWVLGRLFRASPSQHQAHPHSDVRGVQRLLSTAGVAVPRTSDGAAADVTMPNLVGGARPRGGEGCAVVTSTSRRTASTLQPGTGRCLTHTAALPALAHPRLSIAHRGLQREAGLFATTEDQRQSQTISEQRGKVSCPPIMLTTKTLSVYMWYLTWVCGVRVGVPFGVAHCVYPCVCVCVCAH